MKTTFLSLFALGCLQAPGGGGTATTTTTATTTAPSTASTAPGGYPVGLALAGDDATIYRDVALDAHYDLVVSPAGASGTVTYDETWAIDGSPVCAANLTLAGGSAAVPCDGCAWSVDASAGPPDPDCWFPSTFENLAAAASPRFEYYPKWTDSAGVEYDDALCFVGADRFDLVSWVDVSGARTGNGTWDPVTGALTWDTAARWTSQELVADHDCDTDVPWRDVPPSGGQTVFEDLLPMDTNIYADEWTLEVTAGDRLSASFQTDDYGSLVDVVVIRPDGCFATLDGSRLPCDGIGMCTAVSGIADVDGTWTVAVDTVESGFGAPMPYSLTVRVDPP